MLLFSHGDADGRAMLQGVQYVHFFRMRGQRCNFVYGPMCVLSLCHTTCMTLCKRVDHVTIVGDCFDVSGVVLMG